jgi:hypothetical protein
MNTARFRSLSILLSATAVCVVLLTIRLAAHDIWFPKVPTTIGDWTATEVPIPQATLAELGAPPADGYRYTNPFSERVECHVIATATYAAYHEPLICMAGYGFSRTAEQNVPLFGPNKGVRAMILKSDSDGNRLLMYYWIQNRDGTTLNGENVSLHRDLWSRITVSLSKVIWAQPSCIVRAYIQIHPADRLGLQARRNLNEVCLALHSALTKEGELAK